MAWVLVTGGAKGFGREICIELAKRKHPVVIHYRLSEKEASHTAKLCRDLGVEAEILPGDFEKIEDLKRFIDKYQERFGDTKGIINNVGNYLIKSLALTEGDEWHSLFHTNVHAPFYLIRALLPSIKKYKGHIVNIGTVGLLSHRTNPSSPAYGVTKMALWHLTRSLAKELANDSVCVNMVSPGYLETAVDLKDSANLPMKRAASLQEAAHWVAFLFEKEANYITGQNIEIAGGVGL